MTLKKTAMSAWTSAKLYIGFHKDRLGKQHNKTKFWNPENSCATIDEDISKKEIFLDVSGPSEENNVQIKIQPNKIILCRNCDIDHAWKGIIVDENSVSVVVGDANIKINYDGSITRNMEGDTTRIDANGTISKRTPFVEASMSGDGIEIISKRPDCIAAIRENGIVMKAL